MDNKLKEILIRKNFFNIQLCIEYLWISGYSIEDSFLYSKELFNPIISINTDNINNEKELFLLNQLNNCEIKVSNEYPNLIIYSKNDENLFYQDLKNEYFWVYYDKIWSIFIDKYKMKHEEIQGFIRNVMEKHFKLMGLTPLITPFVSVTPMEKHFKLMGLTPNN